MSSVGRVHHVLIPRGVRRPHVSDPSVRWVDAIHNPSDADERPQVTTWSSSDTVSADCCSSSVISQIDCQSMFSHSIIYSFCRNLGKSGLRVSCLGLGKCNTNTRTHATCTQSHIMISNMLTNTNCFLFSGTWVTFGSQISDEVLCVWVCTCVRVHDMSICLSNINKDSH